MSKSDKIVTVNSLDYPTCLIINSLERPMLVVGDVHGCLDELEELIESATKEKEEFDLCFVGDLVDRGPKNWELIEQVIAGNFYMPKSGIYRTPVNIYIIMGNHERKIIRNYLAGKEQHGAQSWFNDLTKEQKDKFVNLYRDVPTCIFINNNIFIAHAAEPDLIKEPLENYDSFTKWLYLKTLREINSNKEYSNSNKCTISIRKRDASICYYGHTNGEKDENGYNVRLFKEPSKKGQLNIFGHQVTKLKDLQKVDPLNGSETLFIDQGCVFGGHLTGIKIYSHLDQYPMTRLSVCLGKAIHIKAKRQYYESEFSDNNEVANESL